MQDNFEFDKDYHYRTMLQNLQKELTTVHNESRPVVSSEIQDFEETRDYELVSLKLFHDFEVANSNTEFYEEVDKANREHDEMVKVVKEKLYAKLENQIKQLKEDKVLLDMANSHSYNMVDSGEYHKNTRSTTQNNNLMDLSINPLNGFLNSDRRGLRRRNAPTDYYNTQNEDSANESSRNGGYTTPNGSNSRSRKKQKISNHTGAQNDGTTSHDEAIFSDAGDLSSLLFGGKEKKKPSTRGSNKSYVSPQGIKTEEVNEDLDLINQLIGNV